MSTVLATFLKAAALSSVLVGVPAGAALAASPAIASGPQLDCHTARGGDNRGHGVCTGSGTWTIHITCNPFGYPERTATTNQTGGTQELSLGCGPVGVKDLWITEYA